MCAKDTKWNDSLIHLRYSNLKHVKYVSMWRKNLHLSLAVHECWPIIIEQAFWRRALKEAVPKTSLFHAVCTAVLQQVRVEVDRHGFFAHYIIAEVSKQTSKWKQEQWNLCMSPLKCVAYPCNKNVPCISCPSFSLGFLSLSLSTVTSKVKVKMLQNPP